MNKYDSLFSRLAHSNEETSPWWSIIENIRVASEALADAQEDFEEAWSGGEIDEKSVDHELFGRIIGRFDVTWQNLYNLREFVAYTERSCALPKEEIAPVEPPVDCMGDPDAQEEVSVDLDDKTLAFIARYAHSKNITINAAICEIIVDQLKKEESNVGSTNSEG